MLVRGEQIEAVGRRREIESLITGGCEVIDAGRRVVMPGFVDAHTHPVFAGIRANEFEQRSSGASYREIAARGGGIRSTVRATRNASLTDLIKTGKRYARWFLRCGTTTIEAKSGYGLTIEDELKILRAIKQLNEETPLHYVPTFLGAHDIPSEYKSRRARYSQRRTVRDWVCAYTPISFRFPAAPRSLLSSMRPRRIIWNTPMPLASRP